MRFKKAKEDKDVLIKIRCAKKIRNKLQAKANLYTEGNLSEFLRYAGLNFIPSKEDFEEENKSQE